ncbi:Gfo/Idh/MocA family oxidoreductase [Segetibacter sp.]|jgi:predicted dehydrogenase|uniref:Gfo/Idh/MocA family protein n=1 Tax=Segetibacter sp. TaxID=2231182 RepID=UPI00262C5706|nr:Gfo/Idh/MocA family oxidoreductase [Segetibacter sp.]MCW3078604.1 Dehydrogenase [Segetibacter sp.]
MQNYLNRRDFVRKATMGGVGFGLLGNATSLFANGSVAAGKRVGIIGLDTSHVTAVTNSLNGPNVTANWGGYKVVAAYPTKGSADMKESIGRLAGFTDAVKALGVEIVDSIEDLLTKVDVVLLESVDGRRHLAEALPVLKAGKRMFIDKPIASSLADAMVIFDAAKKYNVPIFSASSLRYIPGAKEIAEGKIGTVHGADTYGNCYIEPHHPDLFYYGIHGVEMLYALMGTGCKSVARTHINNSDLAVGTWKDDRIGTFRGTRFGTGKMGATVFGEKGIEVLDKSPGYDPLWVKIIAFFDTGIVPVTPEETLETLAFMEAADESKIKGGIPVNLETVMERAKKKSRSIRY